MCPSSMLQVVVTVLLTWLIRDEDAAVDLLTTAIAPALQIFRLGEAGRPHVGCCYRLCSPEGVISRHAPRVIQYYSGMCQSRTNFGSPFKAR
jgi:hypothetical protein